MNLIIMCILQYFGFVRQPFLNVNKTRSQIKIWRRIFILDSFFLTRIRVRFQTFVFIKLSLLQFKTFPSVLQCWISPFWFSKDCCSIDKVFGFIQLTAHGTQRNVQFRLSFARFHWHSPVNGLYFFYLVSYYLFFVFDVILLYFWYLMSYYFIFGIWCHVTLFLVFDVMLLYFWYLMSYLF